MPDDDDIEQCLRRVTRELNAKGDVTINQLRNHVEAELHLDLGFFKEATWKSRSKDIIHSVINEADSPAEPAPKPAAKATKAKAGTKRKSDDEHPSKSKRPRKAAKVEPRVDSDDASDLGTDVDELDTTPQKRGSKRCARKPAHEAQSDEEADENLGSKSNDDDAKAVETAEQTQRPALDESELSDMPQEPKAHGITVSAEDDESDMSSLVDEPPKKKKRGKKATASDAKAKNKPAAKRKPKKAKSEGKELGPDEEEIKRLQGWLVKCGIRKLWHRELASCSTGKEKIKHLKGMLEDVGMTGRYSAEKARQIRDQRELAAELEAAQEFNEQWGQGENGTEEEDKDECPVNAEQSKEVGASRRRMPKGFVDFGDSGDDGSD